MRVIVFEQAVCQGMVISRSIIFAEPRTRRFTGTVFGDVDAVQQVTLQASVTPGRWEPVAVVESGFEVVWDGLARQVRMMIDLKRPASVGMRIEHT